MNSLIVSDKPFCFAGIRPFLQELDLFYSANLKIYFIDRLSASL